MNILKNNLFKSPWYIAGWSVVLTCLGISAWLGLLVPEAINELYQNYGSDQDFFSWWKLLAFILVGEYFNRVFYQLTINKMIQHLMHNIRQDCYGMWLRSYIVTNQKNKDYTLGEILARIMNDTDSIRELLTSGSFGIIIDLFFIVSCFIGFIKLNLFMGTSFIIIEVSICLFMLWGSKFMARVYMSVRQAVARTSRVLSNLVEGFRQTYHTPHHDYALKRGDGVFDDFLQKQLKANIWDASYYSITESLYPLLLVFLVLLAPYSNLAKLSLVAAMIDILQRSIRPVKEVAGKISSIQRALTGIERLQDFQEVLSQRPSKKMDESFPIIPLNRFSLDVSKFTYDQDDRGFSVDNFKMEASPGQMIGIIGKSGSGKSTVLKIITGELEPQKFSLDFQAHKDDQSFSFDKHEHQKLVRYRKQISLISQDSHIFSDSLLFNICLGERVDEVEEFWNQTFSKIEYLQNWGMKLDDQIKPLELSLGQKQLISSLRSCFLSRPIVLLDEISSALDAGLEKALRKVVLQIQERSLLVIVAHRVETVIGANQIILMDQGQIVAKGRHEELEKSSALYQDFIGHLGRV